ncbi:MAG TPA: SRPBCC family protein [Beijerinckiaceae bacterium]|nr:SRPBCC family protein [Beijerinckiaceae bacterium]
MPYTLTFHRVFRASPEILYRAFTDAQAKVKWLPPNGFTAKVHHLDLRVGGGYAMSFTSIATGESHSFRGVYDECEPGKRLRYTDRFDDPNLPGAMHVTVDFRAVSVGTDVSIRQDGVPDVIPPEACHVGWQQSLALLALLVEANV